jgi:lipopolysaccharide export system permease protein
MIGEKWSRELVMPSEIGMTYSVFILLAVGFFFLRQAKNDSRVFDKDIYFIWLERIKTKFRKKPMPAINVQ